MMIIRSSLLTCLVFICLKLRESHGQLSLQPRLTGYKEPYSITIYTNLPAPIVTRAVSSEEQRSQAQSVIAQPDSKDHSSSDADSLAGRPFGLASLGPQRPLIPGARFPAASPLTVGRYNYWPRQPFGIQSWPFGPMRPQSWTVRPYGRGGLFSYRPFTRDPLADLLNPMRSWPSNRLVFQGSGLQRPSTALGIPGRNSLASVADLRLNQRKVPLQHRSADGMANNSENQPNDAINFVEPAAEDLKSDKAQGLGIQQSSNDKSQNQEPMDYLTQAANPVDNFNAASLGQGVAEQLQQTLNNQDSRMTHIHADQQHQHYQTNPQYQRDVKDIVQGATSLGKSPLSGAMGLSSGIVNSAGNLLGPSNPAIGSFGGVSNFVQGLFSPEGRDPSRIVTNAMKMAGDSAKNFGGQDVSGILDAAGNIAKTSLNPFESQSPYVGSSNNPASHNPYMNSPNTPASQNPYVSSSNNPASQNPHMNSPNNPAFQNPYQPSDTPRWNTQDNSQYYPQSQSPMVGQYQQQGIPNQYPQQSGYPQSWPNDPNQQQNYYSPQGDSMVGSPLSHPQNFWDDTKDRASHLMGNGKGQLFYYLDEYGGQPIIKLGSYIKGIAHNIGDHFRSHPAYIPPV